MPPSSLSARLRLGRAELTRRMRCAPAGQRRAMREAGAEMLQAIETQARKRRNLLVDVLGRRANFEAWMHYPPRDAIDGSSGYRFYYHAHARRAPAEHGHFHVFGPVAGDPAYTHLIGISVDDRGFPTRVFTTNRWVTAERWQPAESVLRSLRRLDLAAARPGPVARWVQAATGLFAPQIEAVVRRRDERLDARAAVLGDAAYDDRRTHIVSQCPVALATQFECMQSAGIA